jgi:hypothetical protein
MAENLVQLQVSASATIARTQILFVDFANAKVAVPTARAWVLDFRKMSRLAGMFASHQSKRPASL